MHERRIPLPSRGPVGPKGHLFHRAARSSSSREPPAVVVVPGFIQNRKAFDLPGRSFLEHLAASGFDVYALELARHARHAREGLSWYAEQAAQAMEHALARHEHVAFLGHSMGGLVGLSVDASVTKRLSSFVAISSPGLPGFALPVRVVEGVMARVGAELKRRRRPFRGHLVGAGLRAASVVLDHPRLTMPLQVWAPGHLDAHELAWALGNTFVHDSWGVAADLFELAVTDLERAGDVPFAARARALAVPFLFVACDRDGLAPRRSTLPLFHAVGARDKELHLVGEAECGVSFGHIDVLIGRHAPAHVWSPVTRFLLSRVAKERPAPAAVGPGVAEAA